MLENQRIALEMEIEVGDRHKRAWDDLVQPFFDAKQKELFEHFCDCRLDDPGRSTSILHMSKALDSLKNHFAHFIKTGEMAKQTLDEESK